MAGIYMVMIKTVFVGLCSSNYMLDISNYLIVLSWRCSALSRDRNRADNIVGQ